MKVFGAQVAAAWSNLHDGARETGAGDMVELHIQCSGGTLLCRGLRDGYYLVLLLTRGVPSGAAAFELSRTAAEIAREL
jgi:hypothetical protein